MYSDVIKDEDVSIDLLILADKYDIDILKKICPPKIIEKIDQDNCLDVFLIAKLHQFKDVEKAAFKKIFKKIPYILESPRLKTLIKEYPEEAANLMFRVNKKFVEC